MAIRKKTLTKVLNGATVTERRDSPRARGWDELAAKGICEHAPNWKWLDDYLPRQWHQIQAAL
jgi:hypothetical protein